MCTALIAAWIWYGPGRSRRRQRRTSRLALGDQRAVPPGAVLVGEQHELAVAASVRAARRDSVEQHQREQAQRLGLVRHQLDEQAAEPDRLGAQVVADERVARAGRVALVEDQVDDGEHARAAARAGRRRAGTRYGMRASRILPLARTSRCAIVASGTRNARAISAVVQAAEQAQRERDLGGGRERRVAAGEDQPQPVVGHGSLLGAGRVARRASSAACGLAVVARRPRGAAGRSPGCGPW